MTRMAAPLDDDLSMRMLVENSSDLLARHAPDGTYRYVSPSCQEILGYHPSELVGRSPYELFHPTDLKEIVGSHKVVLDRSDIDTVVYRIRHRDGHYLWLETTSHSIRDPDTGEVVELQTSSRDVTQRKTDEAVIAMSFEHAPIGMALVRADGTWRHLNAALVRMLHREPGALEGTPFIEALHPDHGLPDGPELGKWLLKLDGPARIRLARPNRSAVWVELTAAVIRDAEDNPDFFILHFQDITEQRARERKLELRLSRDGLTGLSNRRAFETALAAVLRSTAPVMTVVVGFADLDDFKRVNDQHGHLAGDQVLRAVAQRLTRALHHGDVVARLGGDEFVFATLLREGETAQGVEAAVRAALKRVRVGEVTASASVGVTVARPGDTSATLIDRADHAMYKHKSAIKAAPHVVVDVDADRESR